LSARKGAALKVYFRIWESSNPYFDFSQTQKADPLHTFGYRFTNQEKKRERDQVLTLKKTGGT
jgi:hypothetical protein